MAASNLKDDKTAVSDSSGVDPIEGGLVDLSGFEEKDPYAALGGKFFEKAVKDTPCKFHDGFSGRCWKGASCPYSHALHSGGKFAEKHPELALAQSFRQVATSVHRLPEKIRLNEERQVRCRVTHMVTPSEFFVRPQEEGAPCFCTKLEEQVEMVKQKLDVKAKAKATMEPYFYGHSAMDPAQGKSSEDKDLSVEDELHSFLSQAYNYTRFQNFKYISKVELVAAFVNNKWKRAVILNQKEKIGPECLDKPRVLVQLLDSGEKVLLPMKQVCRLPEKYAAKPTSAYRCMLWGFSGFFFNWTPRAIRAFKHLVEDRDLIMIVKISGSSAQTFELKPYMIQLKVDMGEGSWIDVGERLYDMGFCLQWNPFPLRPFAVESVDTKCLEAVTDGHPKSLAPDNAVELENARLVLFNQERERSLNDSIDSGTGTEMVEKEQSESPEVVEKDLCERLEKELAKIVERIEGRKQEVSQEESESLEF